MREGERAGHAPEHVRALVRGEPPALDAAEQLGEVEAVDVLHDEIGKGPVRLKVEDGDDVGVPEHAGGARLGEGLVRRGPGLGRERHALDGHAALQPPVPAGAHRSQSRRCRAARARGSGRAGIRRAAAPQVAAGCSRAPGRVGSITAPPCFSCVWPCGDILALAGARRMRYDSSARGRGGIGRRVRFRSVWGQLHEGSSPFARTMNAWGLGFAGALFRVHGPSRRLALLGPWAPLPKLTRRIRFHFT